jgi:hypothetical protein
MFRLRTVGFLIAARLAALFPATVGRLAAIAARLLEMLAALAGFLVLGNLL